MTVLNKKEQEINALKLYCFTFIIASKESSKILCVILSLNSVIVFYVV
jgi:hypothetical protein